MIKFLLCLIIPFNYKIYLYNFNCIYCNIFKIYISKVSIVFVFSSVQCVQWVLVSYKHCSSWWRWRRSWRGVCRKGIVVQLGLQVRGVVAELWIKIAKQNANFFYKLQNDMKKIKKIVFKYKKSLVKTKILTKPPKKRQTSSETGW